MKDTILKISNIIWILAIFIIMRLLVDMFFNGFIFKPITTTHSIEINDGSRDRYISISINDNIDKAVLALDMAYLVFILCSFLEIYQDML